MLTECLRWSSQGSAQSHWDDFGCEGLCGHYEVMNSQGGSGQQNAEGSVNIGLNWLGTVRATAGIAGERSLFYVTGGFAYGQADGSVSARLRETVNIQGCCDATWQAYTSTATWSGSRTAMLTGYTVGSGFNYAVTNNVILKMEALYYDLGTMAVTAAGTGRGTYTSSHWGTNTASGAVNSLTAERKIDGVVAKVGIGYKF